jgi:glycosyltransferase involved in cell wall biosynthesis
LDKLEDQQTEGIFSYSIVVVDNDKNESARPLVESYVFRSGVSTRYHVEPEQNIALARNRTVENAAGDFVAFIDDDEVPESRWLFNHYKAITRYQPDGILGPVLPRFQKKPPRWVVEGRFFDRPSHKTGDVLGPKNTRTGNALLRRALFEKDQRWFNPVFGSGGEDRDFFRRKISRGKVFVWCQEAPVYETVPADRWKLSVMIKRALIRGRMAFFSSGSQSQSLIVSTGAVALYTLGLPFLLFLSPAIGLSFFMNYLIKTFDHLGKLLSVFRIHPVQEKYLT